MSRGKIIVPTDLVIKPGKTFGGQDGFIYLIHFDERYKHVGHYLGWTDDIDRRMQKHEDGYGGRLLNHVLGLGIDVRVARIWTGDRNYERKLKNMGGASRICPICKMEYRR